MFEIQAQTFSRRRFLGASLLTPLLFSSNSFVALGEDLKPGVTEPTVEEALAAINAMNSTVSTNVTSERLAACETMQRSVDRLRAEEFQTYFNSNVEEARRWEDERAVLRYLNASFDKVLKEFHETQVNDGQIVFWHVYNMGYLIKTPTQAFAIDIKHRRAAELVPLIDFLLITHNHGDHFTKSFCDAVAKSGKPVVSNFIENEWTTPLEGREYKFGNCAIKTRRVDHNSKLVNFVSTYEIDCGPRSNNCVIFHVGDACNVNQIKADAAVDVFIPHLAVGLDVPVAVNSTLRPKVTLLSHILELGHLIDQWRWSYEYGYGIVKKCANDSVILPVWGEKYLYQR